MGGTVTTIVALLYTRAGNEPSGSSTIPEKALSILPSYDLALASQFHVYLLLGQRPFSIKSVFRQENKTNLEYTLDRPGPARRHMCFLLWHSYAKIQWLFAK